MTFVSFNMNKVLLFDDLENATERTVVIYNQLNPRVILVV